MPASDAGTEVDEEGEVRTYRGPVVRERLGEIRPRLCELVPHLPAVADRGHAAPPTERMILREVVHRVEGRGVASVKSGISTERGSAGSW
jgi:hypothetical protein